MNTGSLFRPVKNAIGVHLAGMAQFENINGLPAA
jgi:hypothetical protein